MPLLHIAIPLESPHMVFLTLSHPLVFNLREQSSDAHPFHNLAYLAFSSFE